MKFGKAKVMRKHQLQNNFRSNTEANSGGETRRWRHKKNIACIRLNIYFLDADSNHSVIANRGHEEEIMQLRLKRLYKGSRNFIIWINSLLKGKQRKLWKVVVTSAYEFQELIEKKQFTPYFCELKPEKAAVWCYNCYYRNQQSLFKNFSLFW